MYCRHTEHLQTIVRLALLLHHQRPWTPAASEVVLQVHKAEPAVQRNVAPFLQHPILRRLLHSFAQDGSFQTWADNPEIIAMLREALRLLQDGHLTEQQLEHAFMSQLKLDCACLSFSCR